MPQPVQPSCPTKPWPARNKLCPHFIFPYPPWRPSRLQTQTCSPVPPPRDGFATFYQSQSYSQKRLPPKKDDRPQFPVPFFGNLVHMPSALGHGFASLYLSISGPFGKGTTYLAVPSRFTVVLIGPQPQPYADYSPLPEWDAVRQLLCSENTHDGRLSASTSAPPTSNLILPK